MRPGVELAPRKQWPSGLAKLGVNLSGKIGDGPAPGRVIGRLTDLGWGARLRRLLDEPDGEVPDDVVAARGEGAGVVGLGASRPTAVMALDSERHPLLISSLARELARLGRLTDLGTLRYAPERRPVTAANSAYRVAALHGAWLAPDPGVDRRGGWADTAGRRSYRQRVDADDGRQGRARGAVPSTSFPSRWPVPAEQPLPSPG